VLTGGHDGQHDARQHEEAGENGRGAGQKVRGRAPRHQPAHAAAAAAAETEAAALALLDQDDADQSNGEQDVDDEDDDHHGGKTSIPIRPSRYRARI